MSLGEILHGLHWEAACHTMTTGTGAIAIDDLNGPLDWASLYMISHHEYLGTEWEIGVPAWRDDVTPLRMLRDPILIAFGRVGKLWMFSAGIKEVRFSDHVPPSLFRYLDRLERDWTTTKVEENKFPDARAALAKATLKL